MTNQIEKKSKTIAPNTIIKVIMIVMILISLYAIKEPFELAPANMKDSVWNESTPY